MRYFAVTCQHGHHGNGRYVPITFVFKAVDAIDAMDRAKAMPGVKHHRPVMNCREITEQEYRQRFVYSAYKRLEEGLCQEDAM